MIKKVILSTILIYGVSELMVAAADRLDETDCVGWQCEQVVCPKGYAVEIPGKGFLPCDEFEKYVETEDESLLK